MFNFYFLDFLGLASFFLSSPIILLFICLDFCFRTALCWDCPQCLLFNAAGCTALKAIEPSLTCSLELEDDFFQGGKRVQIAGGSVILSTKFSKNKMLNSFIIVNFFVLDNDINNLNNIQIREIIYFLI